MTFSLSIDNQEKQPTRETRRTVPLIFGCVISNAKDLEI